MKKLIIIFLLYANSSYAQRFNTSSLDSFNTPNADAVTNVFMLSTNEMIFTGGRLDGPQTNYPFALPTVNLWKTDANGNLKSFLELSTLDFLDNNTILTGILAYNINNVFEQNNHLVLIGNGINTTDSLPCIIYITTDYNLKIIDVKSFTINTPANRYCGSINFGMICKPHPDGGFYGGFTIQSYTKVPNGYAPDKFYKYFFKMNAQGTPPLLSSLIAITDSFNTNRITTLEYSSNTTHQYICTDVSTEYYLLDSTLQLLSKAPCRLSGTLDLNTFIFKGYRGTTASANNIRPFKGKHILCGGNNYEISNINNYPNNYWYDYSCLNIKVLDNNFHTADSVNIWGDSASLGAGGDVTSFDFIDEDNLFFLSNIPATGDDHSHSHNDTINEKTIVTLTDGNFKVKWSKIIPTPKWLYIQSIKATPDGGFVLTGGVTKDWDNRTQLYIGKFSAKGDIVSVKYLQGVTMEEITVYPNPGADKIYISGKVSNRTFVLFDVQGKVVKQVHEEDFMQGINVADLKAGIYFYTLIDNSTGAVKSGKYLKR